MESIFYELVKDRITEDASRNGEELSCQDLEELYQDAKFSILRKLVNDHFDGK